MSRISEERKEILLRRYGNINTAAGSGAMEPGRGKMSGGFGGPGGKRPLGFGGPRGRAVPNRKRRDKIKILFVFACVLGSSLASLAGSYILRPVINNLVYSNGTAKEKINNLVIGILTMACIYLAGVVCSYLQQRIMIGVSQNALIRIREELFRKIQKLPLKYHDTHRRNAQ